MMIYYDINGNKNILNDYQDHCISHKLDGEDEMSFSIPTNSPIYKELIEETQIDYGENEWLIKKIDDDRFDCSLNFDFLKARAYTNLKETTKPLAYILEKYLPAGWTVYGANISAISRTTEFEVCTDYDVIYSCMKTYSVYFVWEIKPKKLYVFSQDPAGLPNSGEYISKDLNLQDLSFKGETTDFATRIYAYGKDGMTLETATVNGSTYNKQYIDNNNYAAKHVVYIWKDERYTTPNSLYEAASTLLNKKAAPVRSYECTVNDLAKQNSSFAFLQFKMHYKAILLDPERNTRTEHKVVEYKEYPDEPTKNKVTLASTTDTIQKSFKKAISDYSEVVEKVDTSLNAKVEAATAFLLSAYGTYKFTDGNGNTYLADSPNLDTAQSVWLFNSNGIGHSSTGRNGPYTTSITANDEMTTSVINAMLIRGEYIEANSITASKISQSYTSDVISQAVTVADGHITAQLSDLSTNLTSYIDAEAGSIRADFATADTALQNAITVNQNGLAAEITNRQNAITTLQASITANTNEISTVVKKFGTTTQSIKNLLLDSICFGGRTITGYFISNLSSATSQDVSVPSGWSHNITFTSRSDASHSNRGVSFKNVSLRSPINVGELEPNTDYCFSIYLKASTEVTFLDSGLLTLSPSLNIEKGAVDLSGNTIYNDGLSQLGTDWKRFIYKFRTGSSAISSFEIRIRIVLKAGQTATLSLSSAMLEVGTEATTWAESTRDQLERVQEDLSTSITQTADAIRLEATQTIQSTETTLRSYIDQRASSISLAVQEDISGVEASLAMCVQKNSNGEVTSQIKLKSNRISIESDCFTLTNEGVITAKSGTVGGWKITKTELTTEYALDDCKYVGSLYGSIGSKIISYTLASDATKFLFQVTKSGQVEAKGLLCSQTGISLSTESGWNNAAFRAHATIDGYTTKIGGTKYKCCVQTASGIYCGGIIRCENLFFENDEGLLVSVRSLL